MRRSRLVIGGVVTSLLVIAVAWAAGSEDAEKAFTVLSRPTVPEPLDGSAPIGPDAYERPGSCEEARSAYLAEDAPVPAGAEVSNQEGVLLVDLPYARAGVIFTDLPGSCRYRISQGPTLSLEGPDPVGTVDAFTLVRCGGFSVAPSLIAEVPLAGGPHVLVLVPGSEEAPIAEAQYRATLAPGRASELQDVQALPPGGVEGPATVEQNGDGLTATAEVTGGTLSISAVCTSSIFEGLGAP